MRVAAYCRVSTEKESQINSLESQRQYFAQYISRHEGWELVEVYYDEGVSGTSTSRREGFCRMIDDVQSGKIDLVITKEVSRFARNTVDTLSYTRRLRELGVGVLFISDNINTLDPDGELRLTIMASIAQEESRKTSERVKWGQKRKMEQGVVFGRDMLGYRVENGRLFIVPEEAETVRLIFHRYLNEGKGAHSIARSLSDMGVRPKRGERWSSTAVLRVLKNEKYAGDLCQGKTVTPDYLSHRKKYNHDKTTMVCIKNHHEAIIDRDTWEKVQNELERRAKSCTEKSKYSARYWCSGKVVCGECGRKLVSRRRALLNGVYKAWRCYGSCVGIGKCGTKTINEKVLLGVVRRALECADIDKKGLLKKIRQELELVRDGDETKACERLYAEIRALENKKNILIDSMLEGLITKQEMASQKVRYDQRILKIKGEISENESKKRVKLSADKCMERVRRLIDLGECSEEIFSEITDRIVINSDSTIEVFLNGACESVMFKYRVSGRGESFEAEFERV